MINKIVELKDGRIGKVVGEFKNGEFILASGKGGQISSFKQEDVLKLRLDFGKE